MSVIELSWTAKNEKYEVCCCNKLFRSWNKDYSCSMSGLEYWYRNWIFFTNLNRWIYVDSSSLTVNHFCNKLIELKLKKCLKERKAMIQLSCGRCVSVRLNLWSDNNRQNISKVWILLFQVLMYISFCFNFFQFNSYVGFDARTATFGIEGKFKGESSEALIYKSYSVFQSWMCTCKMFPSEPE